MTRRIRIWVLLGLVVLGGTSLFALPPHEMIWEYYTDASLTTLCGEKILQCGGGYYRWGCQTAFYIQYQGGDC